MSPGPTLLSLMQIQWPGTSKLCEGARNATLWHRRMGHLNLNDLKKVHSGINGEQYEVCEVCSMSKLHELPVPRQTQTRAKLKGEQVFSDIQGPFEVPSLQGARYALTFIDDYS